MADAFLAAAKLRRQRVSATPPATDSQVTEPDTCRIGVGWAEHMGSPIHIFTWGMWQNIVSHLRLFFFTCPNHII